MVFGDIFQLSTIAAGVNLYMSFDIHNKDFEFASYFQIRYTESNLRINYIWPQSKT